MDLNNQAFNNYVESKILNFMGTHPKNTHGIQAQTQPNPYLIFGLGLGINLGYLNFWYPIFTLCCRPNVSQFWHVHTTNYKYFKISYEMLQTLWMTFTPMYCQVLCPQDIFSNQSLIGYH